MKWGAYVKRTAIRRVVWIVVGLAVYAVLGFFSDAWAQQSACHNRAQNCSREQAYQETLSLTESAGEAWCKSGYGSSSTWTVTEIRANVESSSQGYYYGYGDCTLSNGNTVPSSGWASWWNYVCPPGGGEWRDDLKKCHEGCEVAPDIPGRHRWDTGSATAYSDACVNGCSYRDQSPVAVCVGSACFADGLRATGEECSAGPTPRLVGGGPDDGNCQPIGNRGAQHCMSKPRDGSPPRHCIVHASGLSQCWDGSETGPRVNRPGTEGAGRETQPADPTPHPNQEGAQAEGSSTAGYRGPGGSGGNFNIIEFSGNGNSADAGDNGSAPGKGSAPGWGNTVGPGPGNSSDGEGDGDGDGDGEGPGKPGQGISDSLYEGDGRTVGQLFDEYRNRVSNAPIATAMDGVFTPPQGGSCPTFTLEASAYWDSMVFDFHCKEPLSGVLSMMGWLVLALAAWLAIRIAIE